MLQVCIYEPWLNMLFVPLNVFLVPECFSFFLNVLSIRKLLSFSQNVECLFLKIFPEWCVCPWLLFHFLNVVPLPDWCVPWLLFLFLNVVPLPEWYICPLIFASLPECCSSPWMVCLSPDFCFTSWIFVCACCWFSPWILWSFLNVVVCHWMIHVFLLEFSLSLNVLEPSRAHPRKLAWQFDPDFSNKSAFDYFVS